MQIAMVDVAVFPKTAVRDHRGEVGAADFLEQLGERADQRYLRGGRPTAGHEGLVVARAGPCAVGFGAGVGAVGWRGLGVTVYGVTHHPHCSQLAPTNPAAFAIAVRLL